MSDTPMPAPPSELEEHQRAYFGFERLMLFAVLHIALTLACVALAFIGGVHVLAFLFWLGGTIAMFAGFALTGHWSAPD